MNTKTVKIQTRGTITIPTDMRNKAQLNAGDLVDVSFERGGVFIKPVTRIDKTLQESLRKALKDLKTGKVHGPFSTSKQLRTYKRK